jgi:hypothetical protein
MEVICVFVLIGIAAGLHAQDAVDPSKPQILVQGVVVDKDSHAPVPGARVSTTAMPGPTPGSIVVSGGATSGGEFQMRLNQGSNLNLMVQASHYQGGQAQVRGITSGQPAFSWKFR